MFEEGKYFFAVEKKNGKRKGKGGNYWENENVTIAGQKNGLILPTAALRQQLNILHILPILHSLHSLLSLLSLLGVHSLHYPALSCAILHIRYTYMKPADESSDCL